MLAEHKPEALEFDSSQQTIMTDIPGLTHESIQKLSDAFLQIEDELKDGCSRQLIVNSLVSLEAINDERARRFIDQSPYQSEVPSLCCGHGNSTKNHRGNQCYAAALYENS